MKDGWVYKKLGEVCAVLNGFAFKSGKYTDSGTRVIRITNVQKGFIVDDDPKYYPSREMQNLNQYELRENDLLMSLTGNVGRVGLLQKELLPAALNQRVACLRIKDNTLSLKFLFHWLNSTVFEQDAIFSASGIAQKNLSTEWLKLYKIGIPSLSVQQHIVEELDLLSSIIEKKKAQLNELDNLVQSLFYEMFGDPITNEKGWVVKTMKEACNEIGDGLHGTPQYDPNGSIAFINGNNLIDGKITITDRTQYVNETEAKKIFIKMDLNTVLLSINGTLGKTAIYNNENVVLGKSACYLRLSNQLTASFVMALMNTHTFKDFLESNSSKSTIKNVGLKAIRNYKVILPPLALQQQFASKIEAIERQKELIKQSIREVETLFNSRMDYYFN